jgi:hypothetical protein
MSGCANENFSLENIAVKHGDQPHKQNFTNDAAS